MRCERRRAFSTTRDDPALLDRGADRIDEELRAAPEAQLRLYELLAKMCGSMSLSEHSLALQTLLRDDRLTEALPVLQKALGLHLAQHDPVHSPATAEVRAALAEAQRRAGSRNTSRFDPRGTTPSQRPDERVDRLLIRFVELEEAPLHGLGLAAMVEHCGAQRRGAAIVQES